MSHDVDKQEMRTTALKDSEMYDTKQRFGLFSQPISTAIADDGPYKTKVYQTNEFGKPVTKPSNMYAGRCRAGRSASSYFGDINSLSAVDKPMIDVYIDPDRKRQQIKNQNFHSGLKNDAIYKPATGNKQLMGSTYKTTPNSEFGRPFQEKNPKRNRDQNGMVRKQQPNILTNKQSTISRTLYVPLKPMKQITIPNQPYGRQHQMNVQKHFKNKLLYQDTPFKLNSFPKNKFNGDKQIYYNPQNDIKERKRNNFNIYPHENKWKSANRNKIGHYDYFQPFPKYQEDPPRQIQRKNKIQEQPFKKMSVAKSTPSSSITKNLTNLRHSINHVFSHHC